MRKRPLCGDRQKVSADDECPQRNEVLQEAGSDELGFERQSILDAEILSQEKLFQKDKALRWLRIAAISSFYGSLASCMGSCFVGTNSRGSVGTHVSSSSQAFYAEFVMATIGTALFVIAGSLWYFRGYWSGEFQTGI